MFEPSGRGDERLLKEALELAHILKYADERIAELAGASRSGNLLLEVQTCGSDGLRFRTPRRNTSKVWRSLEAVKVDAVVDSCGSGDWCTAGLLTRLATNGAAGLREATLPEIKDALVYGQELAAWNCQFEGARGGMYDAHHRAHIVAGTPLRKPKRTVGTTSGLVGCPKCDAA
jgi:fructokinase